MSIEYNRDTWSVVDSLFSGSSLKELVSHQIKSFDDFILNHMEDVINGFNTIKVQSKFNEELKKHGLVIHVDVKNAVLARPMITEKDGSTKVMTPQEARLRNFTYSGALYADIHTNVAELCQNGSYVDNIKVFKNVRIGMIPIMVGSSYCITNTMLPQFLYNKDECKYDVFSYFIINGAEKSIISQDRCCENKTFVFPSNKNNCFSIVAEIRSVPDNVFAPPKLTVLKYSTHSNEYGNFIRCNIHHVRVDIPLFVLFRALGVESDLDIIKHIVYDIDSDGNKKTVFDLRGSIVDANGIFTQRDAMEYLCKHLSMSNVPREIMYDMSFKTGILVDVLKNEFLPHVGKDFNKKALYLGYMARRLLKSSSGVTPGTTPAQGVNPGMDDRDSYINKRVDTPGVLLANIFRQYYGKLVKDVKKMVAKELHTNGAFNTGVVGNIINKHNITRIVKSTIIDAGLKYALSTGIWGLKNNKNTRHGVAQVLNRMTFFSTISHMRRINTPIEKNGKLVQPRRLHTTQFGVICPAETPEGASVGIVKNMTLTANITTHSNSMSVRNKIVDAGLIPFGGRNFSDFANFTKVFVNGDLVGSHRQPAKLYQVLKRAKHSGAINIYTGIYWDRVANNVIISTEAGRSVRPLYVVKNNKLVITLDHIRKLKDGVLGWNNLVCEPEGNVAIEYLDVLESNNSLIASSREELACSLKSYTHMELHPSLMMGVLASSIPFSHHNQSPRNSYQSAMGKQAIGLYTTNFLNRYDAIGHVLNYGQMPLVATRASKYLCTDNLPNGSNVIVAIASHSGFNQEDAIIVNRSSLDRGLFNSTFYRTYKEQNQKNHATGEEEFFAHPMKQGASKIKQSNYAKLGEDGFVPENTYIDDKDVIVGKCMPNKVDGVIEYRDVSTTMKTGESGHVDKNCYNNSYFNTTNGDGYDFCKVRVRSFRMPTIGDKLSCYSEDHDVLTTRGWVPIKEVTTKHKVASLVDDLLIYQRPTAVQRYRYRGDMYNVKSERVDLLVTPNHMMYVSTNDKKFDLRRADEVFGKTVSYMKRAPVWYPMVDVALTDDSIAITLSDAHKKSLKVDAAIRSLGAWLRMGELEGDLRSDGFVAEYLNSVGKSFPDWVWSLPRDKCEYLLHALAPDGVFETNDKSLADGLQRLCLHAGVSCDVGRDYHGAYVCRMNRLDQNAVRCGNGDDGFVPFDDHVYCCTVPLGSGIIYVRRNGKAVFCGNSRMGQKGTIGMVFSQEDMPFTRDGITPDIIINPHAIPSRMTIGQLMETIMSKTCCKKGTFGDGTPFMGVTVDGIRRNLMEQGFESSGNEILYNGRTGEQIETAFFIGPTYYQRLKHMVADKVHGRSSNGPLVMLTRQPAEGRSRDGGLRLGEMEAECLQCHGIFGFLKERFVDCSDHFRVFVCKQCHRIAPINPAEKLFACRSCKNTTEFAELRIPYAYKLLQQEVNSLGIDIKLLTA